MAVARVVRAFRDCVANSHRLAAGGRSAQKPAPNGAKELSPARRGGLGKVGNKTESRRDGRGCASSQNPSKTAAQRRLWFEPGAQAPGKVDSLSEPRSGDAARAIAGRFPYIPPALGRGPSWPLED